jgi:hypothetical protein
MRVEVEQCKVIVLLSFPVAGGFLAPQGWMLDQEII